MKTKILKALQLETWDETEVLSRVMALPPGIEELRDTLGILKGESLVDILSIANEQLRNEYKPTGPWDGIEPLRVGHIVKQGRVENILSTGIVVRLPGGNLFGFHHSDIKPLEFTPV